jgi:hypothetical protein
MYKFITTHKWTGRLMFLITLFRLPGEVLFDVFTGEPDVLLVEDDLGVTCGRGTFLVVVVV